MILNVIYPIIVHPSSTQYYFPIIYHLPLPFAFGLFAVFVVFVAFEDEVGFGFAAGF